MATDNRNIYWADLAPDGIYSSGLAGGGVTKLLGLSDADNPYGVTVDTVNDKIYFTSQNHNAIKKCDLDGSNVVILASGADGVSQPLGIAIDKINQQLYVADYTTHEIFKLGVDGSNFTIVASGADGLSQPIGVAVDEINEKIYIANQGNNNIKKANLDGSSISTIVSSQVTLQSIEVYNTSGFIFWCQSPSEDRVARADLDGGSVTGIVTAGFTQLKGITVDIINNKVLFTDDVSTDTINKCDLDGSNVETIYSSGTGQIRDLDIDQIPTVTNQIDLYITGPEQVIDNIPLFVKLPDFITNEINLYISGPTQITNNIDLFETGYEPINSGIDLYTDGHGGVGVNISLYSLAVDTSSSGLDLMIRGPLQQNDDILLYIIASGLDANWPLFLSMENNTPTGTNPLFMYGSPSGQDLSYRNNLMSLMVWCQGDDVIYPPISDKTYSLFIEVPSGNESGINNWPLFLHSDTRSSRSLDFWVRGKSGLADPIEDSISFYLGNLVIPGQFDKQNNDWPLFIQSTNGDSNFISCYTSGSPIPTTGISGSIDQFIHGHGFANSNIDIYVFGVSGINNDNISLVIPFVSGVFYDTIDMYMHGY